jgi:cellulase/cellobiase CelA1
VATACSIADLTNDGLLDFAITGDSFHAQFYTLIQSAGRQFAQPEPARIANQPEGTTFSPTAIATGKFDGDNLTDVVIGGTPNNSGSQENVVVARNIGGGNFEFNGQMLLGGKVNRIIATDVNNDSKTDLLFSQQGNSSSVPWAAFVVAIGNGNGTFATPVEYLPSMSSLGWRPAI